MPVKLSTGLSFWSILGNVGFATIYFGHRVL